MGVKVRTAVIGCLMALIVIGGTLAAFTAVKSLPATAVTHAVDIELQWTGSKDAAGALLPVECTITNHEAESWVRVEVDWDRDVSVSEPPQGWVLGADGMYYRLVPLGASESTVFRLTGETVGGAGVVAKVKAQAIQREHVEPDFKADLPWEHVSAAFDEDVA